MRVFRLRGSKSLISVWIVSKDIIECYVFSKDKQNYLLSPNPETEGGFLFDRIVLPFMYFCIFIFITIVCIHNLIYLNFIESLLFIKALSVNHLRHIKIMGNFFVLSGLYIIIIYCFWNTLFNAKILYIHIYFYFLIKFFACIIITSNGEVICFYKCLFKQTKNKIKWNKND